MAMPGSDRRGCTHPVTAAQLLRLLGVENESLGKQWGPLLAWFADHQPGEQLWESLVANGYGLQLEHTVPGFKRPIPYRRIVTDYGSKADMQL